MTSTNLARRLLNLSRVAVQVAALFLLFRIGHWVVVRFHLPLPDNIMGMLLLFGLLSTRIVHERWLREAADFLTKHLAFFFVPIAVGLMEWEGLFRREGHYLLLALVVSTLASLLAAGRVVRLLATRPGAGRGRSWKNPLSSAPPSSSPSASTRSAGAHS